MSPFENEENNTRISANNLRFFREGEKTPQEMVLFLKNGAIFRRFDDLLRQLYPEKDLGRRLTEGLTEITGESHDSVSRKVRNWLRGNNIPKSRELLFQICFVLGLDEPSSNRLLTYASETGIHYRNPKELVYAYGLRMGLSYLETVELNQSAMEIYMQEMEKGRSGGRAPKYTRMVREAFDQVWSREELTAFFQEYGEELGTFHETAYQAFLSMLQKLQHPRELEDGVREERYTMEKVLTTYIRMKVPEIKRVGTYSLLQRLMKKYWPNESSLLNMKNRREDVGRKTIMLLHLVTEMMEIEDEEEFLWEEWAEEDPEDVLEIRIAQMDLLLERYGMNQLDLGSPFDLAVMYAMQAGETDFMSDRMTQVLNLLFEGDEGSGEQNLEGDPRAETS